jgi:Undecaprenyl-phosphate glucose phosphotransferase
MITSDQLRDSPLGAPALPSSLTNAPSRLSRFVYRTVTLELLVIFLTAALSLQIYYAVKLDAQAPIDLYLLDSLVITTLVALIAASFHQYRSISSQSLRWYMTSGIGAVWLSFSLFLSLLFLFKIANDYSRGAFIVQILSVSFALAFVRALTHTRLRAAIAKNKIEARRLVLIGRTAHCSHVIAKLSDAGLHVQAIIPFPTGRNSTDPDNIFRRIARQCRPFRPDDILMLATERDFPNVERLASALSELPTSLHMLPIGLDSVLNFSKFSELGLVPTIQLSSPPLSQLDRALKRTFDLVFASLGLIMLSPLLLAVTALIVFDSKGSPIFRQLRHGFNNEPIRVFKFRTMRIVEDGTNFTQAVRNDPRVTSIGRVLRKTNVDELPQLINVILGEMSLVGPRPHPIKLNESFDDKLSMLFRRHNVKPGLTGWAQVNGCRGETDTLEKMRKRLEYDLYYIDHWSFLFDLQIITMTFLSKEAYSNAY